MKAIITFFKQQHEEVARTLIQKGKRLIIDQHGAAKFSIREDGSKNLIGVYCGVEQISLKGKPLSTPQATPTPIAYDRTLMVDIIAEGMLKAEQLADERSQARFADQGHPVATDTNALETFLLSKMDPSDCNAFMASTMKAHRDSLSNALATVSRELDELRADSSVTDLPQAMQDREMLYGRIVKLQEVLDVQRRPENQTDEYMRGLLNGLILAESLMLDQTPAYAKKQSVLYNPTAPMAILYIESTDFPLPQQPAPPAMPSGPAPIPTSDYAGDMPAMPPEPAPTHVPLNEKKPPRQAWK